MDEDVAAGRQPRQAQVLTLEVGGVVVAVADRDPFLDPEELRLAEAAAAGVDGGGRRRSGALRGRVAVTQAESRLLVADRRNDLAGSAQLVAIEAEVVPVAGGGGGPRAPPPPPGGEPLG